MPLDAFCRAARMILLEKNISFEIIKEPFWQRRIDFMKLNPEGDLPVVVDKEGTVIIGFQSLVEYLDETKVGKALVGESPKQRLEVRRLCRWVSNKFNREVIENILNERVFNSLKGNSQPSTERLKAGRKNLKNHLEYFDWVLNRRSFLAGNSFSAADISLGSAVSSLDYLSEIEWKNYEKVKNWYSAIKSRPSFREILEERIYNIFPPTHYKDLDF
tara:strand:+ start:320 stop:970 length:651 start_codon:yes stop_codon:yes gene_type:complete